MLSKKSKMSEPKLVVLLVTDTGHDVRLPMYNLTHIISLISYQRKQASRQSHRTLSNSTSDIISHKKIVQRGQLLLLHINATTARLWNIYSNTLYWHFFPHQLFNLSWDFGWMISWSGLCKRVSLAGKNKSISKRCYE